MRETPLARVPCPPRICVAAGQLLVQTSLECTNNVTIDTTFCQPWDDASVVVGRTQGGLQPTSQLYGTRSPHFARGFTNTSSISASSATIAVIEGGEGGVGWGVGLSCLRLGGGGRVPLLHGHPLHSSSWWAGPKGHTPPTLPPRPSHPHALPFLCEPSLPALHAYVSADGAVTTHGRCDSGALGAACPEDADFRQFNTGPTGTPCDLDYVPAGGAGDAEPGFTVGAALEVAVSSKHTLMVAAGV